MALDLLKYLQMMVQEKASDLHLKVGAPPVLRKNKKLFLPSKEAPFLTHKDIQEAVYPVLKPYHHDSLSEKKQVDFSHGVKSLGRFRFNVFFQRGTLRVVIRHIPFDIPSFEDLNLPDSLKSLGDKENGLVLVTGATGNGKSSTIVALLDYINRTKSKHIITIEDPVEFLIKDRKSLVTQRELGTDCVSYEMALKSSLRQDPDIIFFGELRDAVSGEIALNAANTGHLVFSTLHTNNVSETITRLLGLFGDDRQKHARLEFASCLRAIICQKLLLRKDGQGFYPCLEILINNPRVRNILEDETKSTSMIAEVVESSKDVWGMQSFNQHLKELYKQNVVSQSEALRASDSPEKLRLFFQGFHHENSSEAAKKFKSDRKREKTVGGAAELSLETDNLTSSFMRRKKAKKATSF